MIALDAASRLLAEAVARRAGIAVALNGLPSLVLGATPGLSAACLGGVLLAAPRCFAVAASLLAGLVAIGALARLSLAWSLAGQDGVLPRNAEPDAPRSP